MNLTVRRSVPAVQELRDKKPCARPGAMGQTHLLILL